MQCPHCQNAVSPSETFCSHCGGPVAQFGSKQLRFTPLVPGQPQTRDKAPLFVHAITLLVILGGAAVIYFKFGHIFQKDTVTITRPAAPVATVTTSTAAPPIAPAAQPTPATPPAPDSPVRVGGNIRTPTKVRDVKPVYPPGAQRAGVQGVVIIEATLGPDGGVKTARILRSIPLLDQAALDAVRQWQYTPTLVNGVPAPVVMTVTVQFTLGR